MDQKIVEAAVANLICAIETTRELRPAVKETPNRVYRAIQEMFDGYCQDPDDFIREFEESYDQIVVSKDIDFYSFCEHHLLPFFGQVHIAYMPTGRVLGLSKMSRIVDCFAHRLQLQERLTQEIAKCIMSSNVLKTKGVFVVIESQHLCQTIRGAKKPNAKMVTSVALGLMRESDSIKSEAMRMMGK